MDNMGGLRKLYYIDADDYVSLVKGIDDIYTLTLESEAVITEITFSQGTGRISESEEILDNGSAYNFEASCRIPKCSEGNTDPVGEMKTQKILILGIDNNDKYWLAGAPGSYFDISTSSSTGEGQAGMNARQLKISAQLITGSVFINSPF